MSSNLIDEVDTLEDTYCKTCGEETDSKEDICDYCKEAEEEIEEETAY